MTKTHRFLGVLGWLLAAVVSARGAQVREIYVRSYDGVYIAAVLVTPPGDGPFPAILEIHGGLGGAGMEALKQRASQPLVRRLADAGYVVLVTDYRRYQFAQDEIKDVLAAYRQLEKLPSVDKQRIGVIGGSHGGYLAIMVATQTRPAAVVSLAGIPDIESYFFEPAQLLRKDLKDWPDWQTKLLRAKPANERTVRAEAGNRQFMEGTPALIALVKRRPLTPGTPPYEAALDLAWRFGDRRDLYQAASPRSHADKISSPMLYVIGSLDPMKFTDFNGKKLIELFKARGLQAEYAEIPDIGHGDGSGKNNPQLQKMFKLASEFMDRHVKKVENDPGERKNLGYQQPEKLTELRRLYAAWEKEMAASEPLFQVR